MSICLEWIKIVLLFAAVILIALGYYEIQACKYRDGQRNKDMDWFRCGGKSSL